MDIDPSLDAAETLRSRGLRSTPQRRAILGAFDGGATEHLAADEVHARAAQRLPDLSRATVYATLAEFAETALLAAVGSPEPVRYETNTARHAHFRCRLCLRLYDLHSEADHPPGLVPPGFSVERVDLRAEGICGECADYQAGLEEGIRAITASGPAVDVVSLRGVAAIEVPTDALGPLLLAATSDGLVRLAFAEHADVTVLRALAAARRGSHPARHHLSHAAAELQRYLSGEASTPTDSIDWLAVADADAGALQATQGIPSATDRSYSDLPVKRPPRELGRAMGQNPVPLFAPCHRVRRGVEMPHAFVGGAERRLWLNRHERHHAG